MVKIMVLSVIWLFFINTLHAQKTFELTIKLDTSIDPKKIHYQYENGKNVTFLPDTFGDKRNVVVKGTYYSQLAWFTVSYIDSAKNDYGNNFFLTDKAAAVDLYYKPNDDAELKYRTARNVSRVFDTTGNKILAGLWAFTKREDTVLSTFMMQNKGKIQRNDSLRRVFNRLYKAGIERSMLFLKKYPNDYFSFWYFRNQVVQLPNYPLHADTPLLEKQFAYLKAVFPPKFTESVEGKGLAQLFESTLDPIKKGKAAPVFSFTTLEGKKLDLADFKGKYVLLDFWATWCAPCMAEIPFIKEIRKKYSPDKLVIIGISQDRDRKKWQAAIKREGMDWLHHYDISADIARLYGINWFPTLVLIDKTGKTLYASDNKTEDKDILPDILSLLGI